MTSHLSLLISPATGTQNLSILVKRFEKMNFTFKYFFTEFFTIFSMYFFEGNFISRALIWLAVRG